LVTAHVFDLETTVDRFMPKSGSIRIAAASSFNCEPATGAESAPDDPRCGRRFALSYVSGDQPSLSPVPNSIQRPRRNFPVFPGNARCRSDHIARGYQNFTTLEPKTANRHFQVKTTDPDPLF
jgi:hypothetical protein